jgi:hypothetical protein
MEKTASRRTARRVKRIRKTENSKAISKKEHAGGGKKRTITFEISKNLTKTAHGNCTKGKMNKRFDK